MFHSGGKGGPKVVSRGGSAEVVGGKGSKETGGKGEEEATSAGETVARRRAKRAKSRRGGRRGMDPAVQCARGRLRCYAALSVWRLSVELVRGCLW